MKKKTVLLTTIRELALKYHNNIMFYLDLVLLKQSDMYYQKQLKRVVRQKGCTHIHIFKDLHVPPMNPMEYITGIAYKVLIYASICKAH